MTENYKGRKLFARSDRSSSAGRRIVSGVNGETVAVVWARPAVPLSDQYAAEIATLRAWVDMADERRLTEPDAYGDYWYQGAPAVVSS